MIPEWIYWVKVKPDGRIQLFRQGLPVIFGVVKEGYSPDPSRYQSWVECFTWEEIAQHLKAWTTAK